MIAINHALTGALIGVSIGQPIALPIAFLSHFVLDALPHYDDPKKYPIKSQVFAVRLIIDALLCGLLVIVLAVNSQANWQLAALCAFVATSPDFMWLPRYIRSKQDQKEPKTSNFIIRFHTWIQWFQRPIGIVVELAWFSGVVLLLAKSI